MDQCIESIYLLIYYLNFYNLEPSILALPLGLVLFLPCLEN